MNEINAKDTNRKRERVDGLDNLECPLCGKVVFELDMEKYGEEESCRCIQCCGDCREDFERESGLSLDSNTPAKDVFARLMAYAQHRSEARQGRLSRGLTEANADAVAEALGGEAWQTGGGTTLILFRRPDGRLVVLSDEVICEYRTQESFDRNEPDMCVRLR